MIRCSTSKAFFLNFSTAFCLSTALGSTGLSQSEMLLLLSKVFSNEELFKSLVELMEKGRAGAVEKRMRFGERARGGDSVRGGEGLRCPGLWLRLEGGYIS